MQNQVPGDGCVISADSSAAFLSRGIIDTQSSVGYVFNPLVQNNSINVEGQDNLRIANIEGAEIRLNLDGILTGDALSSAENDNLLHFSKRFSGSVTPGGGTAAFSFTLVDKALLDLMAVNLTAPEVRSEVRAEVTIFGKMGGGTVESIPFVYPVEVCNGCMEVSVGACTDLPSGFSPLTGGVCNPLQDAITQCCTEADGSVTCPAAAPVEPTE